MVSLITFPTSPCRTICQPFVYIYGDFGNFRCLRSLSLRSSKREIALEEHNVERPASIKVNDLQEFSLICLTVTQGGSLRVANFCTRIAVIIDLCQLVDLVIDDHNLQCNWSHRVLRRWRGS